MRRDEAIGFYLTKLNKANAERSREVYRDILDIVKNQPSPIDVVRYRLENATHPAVRAIYRKALRELTI